MKYPDNYPRTYFSCGHLGLHREVWYVSAFSDEHTASIFRMEMDGNLRIERCENLKHSGNGSQEASDRLTNRVTSLSGAESVTRRRNV
jgi:hypothetical protein